MAASRSRSSSGSNASSMSNNSLKLWEDTPHTLTEFGALSSERRPSGGFFSRLWKKNKVKDESSTSTWSVTSDDTASYNEVSPLRSPDKDSSVASDGISRRSSQNSFVIDGKDEAVEGEQSVAKTGQEVGVPHRTLTSVLSRLSSILDQRSSTPQTYKDSDFKQYWMPDSSCRECYDCGDKFTTFRRRHHCRICGQIFCSKCCNQELPGKIIGYKGGIRVCTYCCRVVQRYAQQSASTGDFRALEDLRVMSQSQMDNDSGSFDFGHRSVSPRLVNGSEDAAAQHSRKESAPELPGISAPDMSTPFDLTPQSEFSSQESLLLESKLLIQDSVQLREIWRGITDRERGIETQTLRIRLRTYQDCIVGKELVDWLIKHDRAAKRDQAIAIGQALLYAGYLESLGNQIPIFKDDFSLYKPGETASFLSVQREPEFMPTITEEQDRREPLWFEEIKKCPDEDEHSISEDNLLSNGDNSEALKTQSMESEARAAPQQTDMKAHSDSFSEIPKMTLMSRDMVEEPLPRQDSSVHGLGDDFLKGALFLGKPAMPSSDVVTCPHGWRAVEQLREENGEKLAYDRLKAAHTEHWHTMTRQLLGQYGLLLSWESVISTCITQVSHFVRPDVRLEGDDMDIRNYVHIKKVTGGSKTDTSMFHGVIFTKNIAHKKMKTKIVNPLILLLRGTIEFQRVENKFSSLEPQILQEREFMKNCVMKMIAYRPNVIVVEKCVSRLAQEFLLQAGITLLYNVKLSVMERLARFTQADIVPSIDGLVSRPNMGFCHDFRCQTYVLPNRETKTLAFFDGCATHLGCTIVLRGGSHNELRRVKRVLQFMTYTAYNSLLELCFCMDEFALPQPGGDELGQAFETVDTSQRSDRSSQTLASSNSDKRSVDSLDLDSVKKATFLLNDSEDELEDEEEKKQDGPISAYLHTDDYTSLVNVSTDIFTPTESNIKLSDTPIDIHRNKLGLGKVKHSSDASLNQATRLSVNSLSVEAVDSRDIASVDSPAASRKSNTSLISNTVFPTPGVTTDLAYLHSHFLVDSKPKSRHASGKSNSSFPDTQSGRSTPEIIRLKASDELWNGTPRLVANITCIIPRSAIPVKQDGKEDIQSSFSKPDLNDKGNPPDIFASSFSKALRPSETKSESLLNVPVKEQTRPSSTSLAKEETNPICKVERSNSESRSSTSKITELTDFSDPLLGYQKSKDESIFLSSSTKMSLKEIKQSNYKRFRKALDGVHLSASPYQKYSVPYLETGHGSRCAARKYLPSDIYWSSLFDGEVNQDKQRPYKNRPDSEAIKHAAKVNIEITKPHSFITCSLTDPIWDNGTRSILADFRARGGRIKLVQDKKSDTSKREDLLANESQSTFVDEKKNDCLDPSKHQKLMVLFSSFSYKSNNHPNPCVYPWVVTIEFYGRNDITLGGFLERFCFRQQYSCPSPTCDSPMTDHVRRFVHRESCINVLLKRLDNDVPGGKENILMWSWCRKCKQVTPVVPISADTWSLSFAKYLDLRLHSSSFLRRASADPCSHSLHHDHFQYFGHRNIVASFKYAPIVVRELALPASVIKINPPVFDYAALMYEVKEITYKATDRYSMMLEMTMKLKLEMTSDNQTRTVSEFLAEQQSDKTNFRDAATNIQMKIQELVLSVSNVVNSSPNDADLSFHLTSIFDNITLLKRHICEDVVKWNNRIQEFMIHHQKKSKAHASKKDKDIQPSVLIEELEKSIKSNTESNRTSTSSVSLGSGQVFHGPGHADTCSQEELPDVVVSTGHTDEMGGTLTKLQVEAEPDVSNAPPTPIVPPVPPPTPASAQIQSTPSPLIINAPSTDGVEDSTDGWFQDLKGVTRRFLSTSSFTPIALPFESYEHHCLPLSEKVPVVINDLEPSSIIAYALSSSEYLCRLRELQTTTRPSSDSNVSNSQLGKQSSKTGESVGGASSSDVTDPGRKSGLLSFLRTGPKDTNPQFPTLEAVRYVPGSDLGDSTATSEEFLEAAMLGDVTPSPEEKPKAGSGPSQHIELQFYDSSAKFYCRIYFADQFRKLRKLLLPGSDNVFIRSLSQCKSWEAKGGKSGSSFSKTIDDRFILKQMSNMEVLSFEKFGPQYFHYMKTCTLEQQPTALAKIVGVFRIVFLNTQTSQALRQDVLVMENLFYSRKISQKFDLKGSIRNRLVNTSGRRSEDELVLLDENLLKYSIENPLYMRPHSKSVLMSAITSDSSFLSTNLVMDYSLLVGVDDNTKELVVGIIDYIRTFTWDKRLEMVVKSSGILGGQGKMPTVVSPQLYRGRFLEAMDRYFLSVPDRWTGLGKDSPVSYTNKSRSTKQK